MKANARLTIFFTRAYWRHRTRAHMTCGFFLTILTALVWVPASAVAGDWQVSPIRIDFNERIKTGAVTVFNGGDTEVRFQIRAYEWTQDSEGKDLFEETDELYFYPRMMTLSAKSQKIIRTGVKQAGGSLERNYRLFIQEIPGPIKEDSLGVSVAVRFGVPVFVQPGQPLARLDFENSRITNDGIQTRTRNAGNVNVAIEKIVFSGFDSLGSQQFVKEIRGWYLLRGSTRLYAVSVPGISCDTIKKVTLSARTDKGVFERTLDSSEGLCVD